MGERQLDEQGAGPRHRSRHPARATTDWSEMFERFEQRPITRRKLIGYGGAAAAGLGAASPLMRAAAALARRSARPTASPTRSARRAPWTPRSRSTTSSS